jgi:threonine dehydrogenase-like Zn-dependent dehydrogenase
VKAFILTTVRTCEFIDLPDPVPGPGEVLLRPRFTGLCGSDLKTFRGENPLAAFPRIPGHELSAVIAARGSAVPAEWAVGDEVTVLPYSNCGTCSSCLKKRPNACESNKTLGVQRDGCLAGLIAVPFTSLVKARGIAPPAMALAEPLAVGCHAVRRSRCAAGETVAVIGCGAVGLGAVAAAASSGARVVAVDIDDAKLEVARLAGAAFAVNSGTRDLHEALRSIAPHGPDAVIEAVGSPSTFRAAVDEVSFAGRVVYVGYAREPVSYETKLFVQKELDILGSRNAERPDFDRALGLLASGGFPAARVVTRTVEFGRTGEAFGDWDRDTASVIKILVSMP